VADHPDHAMQDIHPSVVIHPSAQLYGRIRIGEGSSVWPNVVMRSEMSEIVIGRMTNVQDFTMVHVGEATPTLVGDFCSLTHHTTIHACVIEDFCLIGIGAVVMDGAVIGRGSIVAGGAVVTEGTVVPPGSVVAGVPAKVRASRDSARPNRVNAWLYHRNAQHYARGDHRGWDGPEYESWKVRMEADVEADRDLEELGFERSGLGGSGLGGSGLGGSGPEGSR
jgi:carbonic anhydrase/acetyltransferase-like protein (isoleucine patch superfamily)